MSNNIDDELLALAGGEDSSDEEEEVMSEAGSRGESASPPPAKKSASKGAASKKATAKRAKQRAQDSDDDEEGEAFSDPGSPNSIGSAAMDESDSEAENNQRDSVEPDEDEKYPIDGMFRSIAEKEHVMGLKEIERESLLADRSAEIERQRQNRMLRQLVTKQENEEKKKLKKRSADNAELDDDDYHRSSRPRTETTKTGAAIDNLKRARAEKHDRARAREENRRQDRRSPRRDRRSSSLDSRGSYDRHKSGSTDRASPPRELPPPTLRDFERIRVGRSRFAQYCFNPGFEDAIAGCYVRVSLGPDPKTGVDDYRMAKIKGFTTGKAYAMSGPGGSFVTDQYVLAAHGKAEKTFAFIFCSDKGFTEREFNRYVTTLQVEGLTLAKTQQLINKIDDINRFVERSLTSAEIDEKVERKKQLRSKYDPERRERLRREIEEAYAYGKEDRAKELELELEDLQSNRLAFRTTLGQPKATSTSVAQQDRLADINRERRRQNAANVSKAQLKEKAEARKREQAMERGEMLAETDMSRRIRTKAVFVHENRDGQQGSGVPSPAKNGAAKQTTVEQETEAVMPHLTKALENARKGEQKKGLPGIHRPIFDDDIIGQIDLEIDVDID